ncbi:hypothetical protein H0H93_006995 [Arthromyces matolae]|nr:hypothetical protein H0H93_006995 [Arthromyces matolae]
MVHSKPLFSDIVFRNLRLRDKNVYATVNFTLPTAYFRQSDLNAYDLRGSIAVIPTSPSPLDRIVDYSTWIPRFIDTYPVRSWPFPMGSSGSKNKSVADRAIDSFGVTVPLLQFHNVRKKCETDVEYIDDYGDDELRDNTKHRSPVSHHPYVVTRTQIRMVDETAPFDRRWYLKKHQLLMRRSCNQQAGLFPSVHECDRSYIQVGHVETAMNLKSSESEGENEVAYSPYISLSRRVGPKDLFPIPINRQICASPEEYAQASADDQDSVEISWNLAFSGRTFRKFVYLEEIEKYNGQEIYDMELSDHHLALAHDDVEFGGKLTFAISNLVLDLLYWYTRTTTIGISTLGSFLFAGSKAVEVLVPQLAPGVEGIFGWLQLIFSAGLPLLPVVFLIKRICHIRRLGPSAGSRWARWILYPTPLTYDERASQRIENQMSYWSKGCVGQLHSPYRSKLYISL